MVIYPFALALRIIRRPGPEWRKLIDFFLHGDNLAAGFTSQLVTYYQVIVFIPNIVGAFGDILLSYYKDLGIPQELVIGLLFTHLLLLLMSGVGLGLLQTALNNVFPAILGELLLSWTLYSGSFLFLLLLAQVSQVMSMISVVAMSVLLIVYLLVVTYYATNASADKYIQGAQRWNRKGVP
jgi:hypothetical protein